MFNSIFIKIYAKVISSFIAPERHSKWNYCSLITEYKQLWKNFCKKPWNSVYLFLTYCICVFAKQNINLILEEFYNTNSITNNISSLWNMSVFYKVHFFLNK